jgi:hypothetical protein
MITIALSLVAFIVGLVLMIYTAVGSKPFEIGRIVMLCGLLAFLLSWSPAIQLLHR